jgi:hypothetical protein
MAKRKKTETKPFTIPDALEWIWGCRYFHSDEAIEGRVAIPYIHKAGAPDARLVLVLGDNAGGKSFFRRLLQVVVSSKYDGPFPVREVIHLSMQGRSAQFASMVYGTEEWQSTGENSAHTVTGGIKNATGRDHDVIVYWDEPDIGMSEGSAAGAGLDIAEFVADAPEHIKAIFITTHSKAMAEMLTHLDPHYIYLGDGAGPRSLKEWLTRRPTPVRPADLKAIATQRYRDIQALLNASKK